MKKKILTLLTLFVIVSCSKNIKTDKMTSNNKSSIDDKVEVAILNLKNQLVLYKNQLNNNNIGFDSKESYETLYSVLNISSPKQKRTVNNSDNLTKNQKEYINNLSVLLSNSNSPEEALEILDKDLENIQNSKSLTENEKIFLMITNKSIRLSTQFIIDEFGYYNRNFSITARRSWWGCLKKAYADLTDDFVGTLAVGVFPGPCCAAILIGGTVNYCRQ